MQLSQQGMEQASAFIFTSARPLEQALCSYYFRAGKAEEVYAQLARFQNADGGFGHALEPDLRLPDSSAIATTVGLQLLRELEAPETHPLVGGTIGYLLDTYDAERERWPIIPATAKESPRAPWWHYDDDLPNRFGQFLANPRAEIAGYLYDYAGLVPGELLHTLTQAVIAHLDSLPDDMEMHDLLCYARLAETRTLPEDARAHILQKLRPAVDHVVAREPSDLEHYGLAPLTIAPSPDSPFAAMLAEAINWNLDYVIEHQQADGAWWPNWSWGDAFPEAWPTAEREWKGVITVGMLRRLQLFGRLEAPM